jgi:hypothetical protein
MKIAIFGDSFADDIGMANSIPKWTYFTHIGPSYIELLERHTEFQITRYGFEGSSLYYSLTKFEEFHKQYDKVIFVTTEASRLFVNNELYNIPYPHIFSLFAITMNKEDVKKLSTNSKKLLSLLEKFYFPEISKRNQSFHDHDMLKKKIKRIRPDAIVVCGIGNYDEPCLNDVSTMEIEHWGLTWAGFSGGAHIDRRKCHLTEENNEILYKGLLDSLKNGTQFDIKSQLWVAPTKPADFYRSKGSS